MDKVTVAQLKKYLEKHGCRKTGNKNELYERFLDFVEMNNKSVTEEFKRMLEGEKEETVAEEKEEVETQDLIKLNTCTGESSGRNKVQTASEGTSNYETELGNMFSRTPLVSLRRLRNEDGMPLGASADEVERSSVVSRTSRSSRLSNRSGRSSLLEQRVYAQARRATLEAKMKGLEALGQLEQEEVQNRMRIEREAMKMKDELELQAMKKKEEFTRRQEQLELQSIKIKQKKRKVNVGARVCIR